MGQILHGSARTTAAVRRAIQHSHESLIILSRRHGINPKTVAKWKRRTSVSDLPTGPKDAKSTTLSIEEEAIIVAFCRHTLLSLDDCLYALQATIPHLTRSSLHRCIAASLFATSWRQPVARSGWGQRTEEEVQDLLHRLLPHRHRRSAHRPRQAAPLRRPRPHQQVRFRPARGKGEPGHRVWRQRGKILNDWTDSRPLAMGLDMLSQPVHDLSLRDQDELAGFTGFRYRLIQSLPAENISRRWCLSGVE